jgi:hypothetical protein
MSRKASRDHLHRRDRQDLPQGRQPVDHARRFGRGRSAGAAEDPRGHDGEHSVGRRRKHPQQEFTSSIRRTSSFICGGAFIGLEKVVEKRMRNKSLDSRPSQIEVATAERIDQQLEPEDLIHYGSFPSSWAPAGRRHLEGA